MRVTLCDKCGTQIDNEINENCSGGMITSPSSDHEIVFVVLRKLNKYSVPADLCKNCVKEMVSTNFKTAKYWAPFSRLVVSEGLSFMRGGQYPTMERIR